MTWSSAVDIKGLENRFVCVIDIDSVTTETELDLLYVALSRPRAGLWVATSPHVKEQLRRTVQAASTVRSMHTRRQPDDRPDSDRRLRRLRPRRQLVGPFDGPAEIIFDPPNRRYLMGILFPRQVAFEGYVETEGEERDETSATDTGEESQFSDDPVSAANDFLPASQGLSFFTTAPELTVRPAPPSTRRSAVPTPKKRSRNCRFRAGRRRNWRRIHAK